MISLKPNYLPKAPPPNTIALAFRASTYKFVGGVGYKYIHRICKLFPSFYNYPEHLKTSLFIKKISPHELSRLFLALRYCEIQNIPIKIYDNLIL